MNEDELADAYNEALALEKAQEFDKAAKAYNRVLKIDPEDHGGAKVRLASMGKAPPPERASNAYVATLFDQHADIFDKVLVEDLGYDVPKMAAKIIQSLNKDVFKRALDLGCGTGLMGLELEQIIEHLTGIDLAENMLEIAHDRDVYDALFVADVEDYLLDNDDDNWDLITATDVLPYLGDIEKFTTGLKQNLSSSGYAIFSTETLADSEFDHEKGYTVGKFQRFAHQLSYIVETFERNELDIIEAEQIIVRHEQGQPIFGHLVLVQNRF